MRILATSSSANYLHTLDARQGQGSLQQLPTDGYVALGPSQAPAGCNASVFPTSLPQPAWETSSNQAMGEYRQAHPEKWNDVVLGNGLQ